MRRYETAIRGQRGDLETPIPLTSQLIYPGPGQVNIFFPIEWIFIL